MKERAINDAMWDVLHILGAGHHPLGRIERLGLQAFVNTAQQLARTLVTTREGRALQDGEVRVIERLCAACLRSYGDDPQPGTPPGGTRAL